MGTRAAVYAIYDLICKRACMIINDIVLPFSRVLTTLYFKLYHTNSEREAITWQNLIANLTKG